MIVLSSDVEFVDFLGKRRTTKWQRKGSGKVKEMTTHDMNVIASMKLLTTVNVGLVIELQ